MQITTAWATQLCRPNVRTSRLLLLITDGARTFFYYRAKPKCNFYSSSSVRWILNVTTIVADCVDYFFGEEKETKYGWRICKNVNTFETAVGVQLLDSFLPIVPTFGRQGNLSKPRRQRERYQTKGLKSRTTRAL